MAIVLSAHRWSTDFDYPFGILFWLHYIFWLLVVLVVYCENLKKLSNQTFYNLKKQQQSVCKRTIGWPDPHMNLYIRANDLNYTYIVYIYFDRLINPQLYFTKMLMDYTMCTQHAHHTLGIVWNELFSWLRH
jgi:hypothetical protein